jgi:hypothetical protein
MGVFIVIPTTRRIDRASHCSNRLGKARSTLSLLQRKKEESGFDEGHGVRLAARAIIQEPLSFFLQIVFVAAGSGQPAFRFVLSVDAASWFF